MKDPLTGAITYSGFKKSNFLSELKARFVLKGRKKMYRLFVEQMHPSESDCVLDAGVTPAKSLLGAKTITNNFFEAFYPYTRQITATSIEDASNLEKVYEGLVFVQTEPYKTPFKDRQFDIVFSNAVVEHTGSREQQKAFIEEYCRVGKRFFFTTPNRWFPIEMHSMLPLVHWLPDKYFKKILKLLGMNALTEEGVLNLLSKRDFLSLFPEHVNCRVLHIRTAGFVSNLIVCGEWQEG